MARKRKIVVTSVDRDRLEELFASPLAQAFSDKPYLHGLRQALDSARIIDTSEMPNDVITMNSTVRLIDMQSRESETFTLVYPEDADIAEGKLSILAPLGTAILGNRVGDTIRWKVPSGEGRWRVEEVVYQPEREGVAA
ncbi:nucleoside diphosphate kinase regulator [Roseimaritima sediminicola]|uniref:nucleoside diphosphate kinase regulator n=1 Tax=Roseimaritima sediminicola TaxID=2662066 RepID=UPI001298536F|nr:nucleoside diphosphate kinase regulator [Roseimaritima sediminicola]